MYTVALSEARLIFKALLSEIHRRDESVQGIYDVELKHFVPIILEEPIKLVFNQVNKGYRATDQISLNNVSAFVAAEAIICGYNLSPSAYFLAIKDGKRR